MDNSFSIIHYRGFDKLTGYILERSGDKFIQYKMKSRSGELKIIRCAPRVIMMINHEYYKTTKIRIRRFNGHVCLVSFTGHISKKRLIKKLLKQLMKTGNYHPNLKPLPLK